MLLQTFHMSHHNALEEKRQLKKKVKKNKDIESGEKNQSLIFHYFQQFRTLYFDTFHPLDSAK